MDEDKEEGKEEGEESSQPAKGKSKKKLIIIIAAVVLVLAAGVPAFLMLGGKKEKPQAAHEAPVEKHYMTADLDPFIVNLSEANSFLKISIILEYDPEILHADDSGPKEGAAEEAGEEGEGGGEGHGGGGSGGGGEKGGKGGLPAAMQERTPMIHDAIIRVLSSKKPAEVLTPEGKEQLKEELIEAINEAIGLEEGPVVGVYFKEFIIQ